MCKRGSGYCGGIGPLYRRRQPARGFDSPTSPCGVMHGRPQCDSLRLFTNRLAPALIVQKGRMGVVANFRTGQLSPFEKRPAWSSSAQVWTRCDQENIAGRALAFATIPQLSRNWENAGCWRSVRETRGPPYLRIRSRARPAHHSQTSIHSYVQEAIAHELCARRSEPVAYSIATNAAHPLR